MDKKLGGGCAVVCFVVVFIVQLIKTYKTEIVTGLIVTGKILLISLIVITAIWLYVKIHRRLKEKREQEEIELKKLQADTELSKMLIEKIKDMERKIQSSSDIVSLHQLLVDNTNLNSHKNFSFPQSEEAVQCLKFYQQVTELLTTKYYQVANECIEKINNLTKLEAFYRHYILSLIDNKQMRDELSKTFSQKYEKMIKPMIDDTNDIKILNDIHVSHISSLPNSLSALKRCLDSLFSLKYENIISRKVKESESLNELINCYQMYTFNPNVDIFFNKRLQGFILAKIQTIEIEPSVLQNDILANNRPCYIKMNMTEIPVRIKNSQFNFLSDKSSIISIYLFDNLLEFKSTTQHYSILLKNIIDMQRQDNKLILHLRAAGGHKCYEGELIPILYCLIKKLQAKNLS